MQKNNMKQILKITLAAVATVILAVWFALSCASICTLVVFAVVLCFLWPALAAIFIVILMFLVPALVSFFSGLVSLSFILATGSYLVFAFKKLTDIQPGPEWKFKGILLFRRIHWRKWSKVERHSALASHVHLIKTHEAFKNIAAMVGLIASANILIIVFRCLIGFFYWIVISIPRYLSDPESIQYVIAYCPPALFVFLLALFCFLPFLFASGSYLIFKVITLCDPSSEKQWTFKNPVKFWRGVFRIRDAEE